MSDPGFKIEGVQEGAPFRSREIFENYFACEDRESAVLIDPAVAQGLRVAAMAAYPDETGGLLSGRTLCDGDGSYIVVSGFVEANPGAGQSTTFRISPQDNARLREELSRLDPVADVIGWWHSHPCPSPYSSVDLDTQRMWDVGLLVFASGNAWGTAYWGAEARPLSFGGRFSYRGRHVPIGTDGEGRADPTSSGPSALTPVPDARPSVRYDMPPEIAWRPTRRFIDVLLVAAVALITLILMLYILGKLHDLSGQISSGESQVTRAIAGSQGSVERILAKPEPPPSVQWRCARQALLVEECAVTADGSPGVIEWELNGQVVDSGLNASIELPKNFAPDIIQLILRNSSGTYLCGSKEVYP